MRLTPLLTAAVLVTAPVVATAMPASAATCTTPTTRTEVAPRSVVVDTTGTSGFDVRVTVEHHGCAIGPVQALITSPTRGTALLDLAAEDGNATTTVYVGGSTCAPVTSTTPTPAPGRSAPEASGRPTKPGCPPKTPRSRPARRRSRSAPAAT